MSLTTVRKKSQIGGPGGNYFKLMEVNEDNTPLSSPDTAHDLGEIKDYTLITKPAYQEEKNVLGLIVKRFKKDETIGFDATLMQSASAQLSIPIECNGKFYWGYHDNGIVDNYYQEFFWAAGSFTPKTGELKYTSGGAAPTYEVSFEAFPNDSVVSIPASAFGAHCGTGSMSANNVSIPALQGWKLVETSVTAV